MKITGMLFLNKNNFTYLFFYYYKLFGIERYHQDF